MPKIKSTEKALNINLSFRVSKEIYNMVKDECMRKNISEGELIRRAIKEHLNS